MRLPTSLTPSEIEILKQGRTEPNIFCDYFFRPPGEDHGWRFDHNFEKKGAWQLAVTLAEQHDITIIGGFGTGKTVGIGMGATYWGATCRDFKFLNVGPNAWQAKLMYDNILTNINGTRFEDFIWEKPRRPHPKIVIRYTLGKVLYESTLEFMSADKDATGILSWEGDWLHVDEAGLLDNLEEVIINAGSRLRGSIRGRPRLGRFSMASNSWDNHHLWYYFDLASGDPENFLSIVVSSRDNRNVTDEQLERMIKRIPEDERQRFIDGTRPEGRGWYFAKDRIYACEDKPIGQHIEQSVKEDKPGYLLQHVHGTGVVKMRMPPKHGSFYMLLGDPGVGQAPLRNAPVLMLWNVDNFPRKVARLYAFWWGCGFGRIGPFVDEMFELIKIYRPIFTGIDSTGPQKNMNFLINEYLFKEKFKETDEEDFTTVGYDSPLGRVRGIGALDFSGTMKHTYLQAARLLIEGELLVWPKNIVGIRSQLSNYDPEKDKRIAQDIVATIGMSAHAIRTWFHVDPKDLLSSVGPILDKRSSASRRLSDKGRTRRTPRTRAPKSRVPT